MSGGGGDPDFGRSPAGRPEDVGVQLADEHKSSPEDQPEENVSEVFAGQTAEERAGGETRKKKAESAGEDEKPPGDRSDGIGEQGVPVDFAHDVGASLIVTVLLFGLLVACAGPRGETVWVQFAVFGVGYGGLFACEWFWARARGRSWGEELRVGFVECRLTVGLFGFAAVLFGSPTLLGIAPDVLAVAGAIGGGVEGRALGLVARDRGVSAAGAARVALRTWRCWREVER